MHLTLLLAFVLLAFGGRLLYADASARSVWPVVRKGIWEVKSKRTVLGGKSQEGTIERSACTDTSDLFRGYWGSGIIEAAGCRYNAVQVCKTEFRIASRCMIRRAGVVEGRAVVTVVDETSFSIDASTLEGKRRYLGREEGRWIRACPTKNKMGAGEDGQ